NGEQDYYNDNPYANPENYDEYGNYVGPTHWWQFWKKSNNNYQNGEDGGGNSGDEQDRTPWWFVWGEQQREGGQEEEEGSTAVLIIYIWTLVAVAGMIYLANTTGMAANKLEGLRWALLGFANYCFVTMVLLIGLEGIDTEGRALEEDGFYGQTAVLLFLTCFFGIIQSIVFVSWTSKRLAAASEAASPTKQEGFVNVDYERSSESGYMGPQAEKAPSSGWLGV
ncbi:MAG: hypothetical protein SGARI_002753, partial [Bacillariaceae sp.]